MIDIEKLQSERDELISKKEELNNNSFYQVLFG